MFIKNRAPAVEAESSSLRRDSLYGFAPLLVNTDILNSQASKPYVTQGPAK